MKTHMQMWVAHTRAVPRDKTKERIILHIYTKNPQ